MHARRYAENLRPAIDLGDLPVLHIVNKDRRPGGRTGNDEFRQRRGGPWAAMKPAAPRQAHQSDNYEDLQSRLLGFACKQTTTLGEDFHCIVFFHIWNNFPLSEFF
jgi:hypothetical protein